MTLTRKQILSSASIPREPLTVPDWGGDVFVQGMTGDQRDEFEDITVANQKEGAGCKFLMAKIVCWCVVDEKGNRIFEDGDAGALQNGPSRPLAQVYDIATRLSGLTKEDLEALGKLGTSDQSDGSGSSSPSS